MAVTPITWKTPLTNASINVDGDLEKDAGSDNCFTNASGSGDAGARSNETISSGDWEFGCTLGPVGGASGRSFVGIDHGSSYDPDFTNWDYCIHISTEANTTGTPHPANSLFIYEGSPPNKTYIDGIWSNNGDLLRIVCQSNVVRYYINSLLIYTSPTPPTYSLFAVVSLACLNKTIVDPYFLTGGISNPCEAGIQTGDSCSASWTMPTPSALPLPSNGGPRPSYFDELEPDWGEFSQKFADGQVQANTIQTDKIRKFRVEWDGLSEAQAAALDAHFESTRGALKFTVVHPYTSESITNVRYNSYDRSPHKRVWSQSRSAELIRYTS